MTVTTRKKLIEVALPLEAINAACVREKDVKVGKPNNMHLWWAPRPHAAARAVIFAQMVDDPSSLADLFPTQKAQDKERERLFRLLEELVKWENTNNEIVIEKARAEIWASWRRACADNADHPNAKQIFSRDTLPGFHDPFAGGGALPLEAQRFGLETYATDLNPVAVVVNKAKIEAPSIFAGRPPINPDRDKHVHWKASQGLVNDIRYYGEWMRAEAEKRIGSIYPKIEVTAELATGRPDLKPLVGQTLTVVAWIWARTVKSPNPAYSHIDVPLASTFLLSTKSGKEAYIAPNVEGGEYRFLVKMGMPENLAAVKSGTKLARANFECIFSGTPISGDYIKAEGKAGRIGARLMAIVAEGPRGRIYLSPDDYHELAARVDADWRPEGEIPLRMTGGNCTPYGLTSWGDLFTGRQLVALTTFADLIDATRNKVIEDAADCDFPNDERSLADGGSGKLAYADSIAVYLSLALSRSADWTNTLTRWLPHLDKAQQMFSRHAIPMGWDYVEINALSDIGGSFIASIKNIIGSFERLPGELGGIGHALQADASTQSFSNNRVVSTDPPYYDNIGYADLSDFFYVWLRRCLKPVFPELMGTLAVPKKEELVATAYRHPNKDAAERFFLKGMTSAMNRLSLQAHEAFPVTIYYAFKQSESDSESGTTNTGWDTFLAAVIEAGFEVTGTWPIRTEKQSRTISNGTNALASSIVLVCRRRSVDAPQAMRREFVAALKDELPKALQHLQEGNIAPVDLAQAAIGPGMAVYTRFSKVVDNEGHVLTVREALALINEVLGESLAEQEGDFDPDSRWAIAWFEQNGFAEGEFGVADVLARAKVTAVTSLVEAGVITSGQGRVRLLKADELHQNWDPEKDARLTAWESVHQLVRALSSGGEKAAAVLAQKLGSKAEVARELAYRLYVIAERKKRPSEALSYNALVQSWPEIMRLAQEITPLPPAQGGLFETTGN